MHSPLPRFTLRARRVGAMGLSAAILGGAVIGGSAALLQSAPAAAGDTTYAIGATPVRLTQATDPEIGRITPTADADVRGMFGTQAAWPLIPLHAAVARNGDLVTYGTPLDQPVQGGLAYDVWNPASSFSRSDHVDSPSMHSYDSFCNSLVQLSDGRFLMVGGNTSMGTMLFDPATGTQTMGANLSEPRWYGTTIRTEDGRILVLGGAATYYGTGYQMDNDGNIATTPEIGTGTGPWTQLTGATSGLFGAKDNRYWYPRAFNAADGQIIGLSGGTVWSLSTAGAGSVTQTGTLPFNPKASGSQVMYAPGKILVAGGGQPEPSEPSIGLQDAAVVDVTGGAPVITRTADMQWGRNWLNLTVLPTGDVFANGGTRSGIDAGDDNSVRTAEIWSPDSGRWSTGATAQRTRTYHSTSLLMPSGAVFTGGGGAPGPEDNLNAELYYPSYLFTKDADGVTRWASRPAITTIAGSATYGGRLDLTVAEGRQIQAASLISLPSVTHSQNTDQRRIPLSVVQTGAGVQVTLPTSFGTMPAGDYELTVVDRNGVPSAAQILTIRRDGPGLVTTSSDGNAGVDNATGPSPSDVPSSASEQPSAAAPAGAAPTTPTAPTAPTAPISGAPAPTTPTVGLTIDSSVTLQPASRADSSVSASGSAAVLRTVTSTSPATRKRQASWMVRPGLASTSGLSFESVDRPGYYLAAPTKGSGSLTVARSSGSKTFASRATFVRMGGNTGANVSFTTWSQRSRFLQAGTSRLQVGSFSGSRAGRSASTFLVHRGLAARSPLPLTSGRSVGFETVGGAGHRIIQEHGGVRDAKASASSGSDRRRASSWIVRATKGGLLFESASRRGYFLAASSRGNGTVLLKRSDTGSFRARAVFVATGVVAEGNRSFHLRAKPSRYLQVKGSRVTIASIPSGGRAAAAFVLRSGLAPSPTS